MTKNQAYQIALRKAQALGEDVYVVYEGPEDGYQVALEGDLYTYFLGTPPLFGLGPDGDML